jgi:plastocyanin
MRRVLFLVPAAVLLAGCGGGGGGGGAGGGNLGENPGVSGNQVTIILKDFTLTPDSIKLPKPGKYTIKGVNEGASTHNIEVEGQGLEEKGKNVSFGDKMTFTVDFKKPGEYEIYCPVDGHRALGMEGTLTVGSA